MISYLYLYFFLILVLSFLAYLGLVVIIFVIENIKAKGNEAFINKLTITIGTIIVVITGIFLYTIFG